MKVSCLIFALFLSLLQAESSANNQALVYAEVGEFEVETTPTVSLTDEARSKTLEALVRYPKGAGPFPVVVFSHGGLANKEAFAAASEHWASHGYIVIHPNHADARSGEGSGFGRWRDNDGTAEKPADSLSQSRSRLLGGGGLLGATGRIDRVKDVSSVMDALDQIEAQIPALKGKLDRNAIAVAGHSFGAYVAQCHGGVKTLVDGALTDLSDPRVKCVVPISAQGESQTYGLTSESWDEAWKPAMHITGTRDSTAPDKLGGKKGDVSTKRVPFERSPAGSKYLLIIEGAHHVSFGGKLSAMRGGVDAANLTKVVALAFLNAQLKADPAAKAWLDGDASTSWLGDQATLERKLSDPSDLSSSARASSTKPQ